MAMYLADPSKRLVPALVITLTIAPWARPYSTDVAEVEIETSWMASKFRLVPNVPVVGSVVSTESTTNRLPPWGEPRALTLLLPVTMPPTTPGVIATSVW